MGDRPAKRAVDMRESALAAACYLFGGLSALGLLGLAVSGAFLDAGGLILMLSFVAVLIVSLRKARKHAPAPRMYGGAMVLALLGGGSLLGGILTLSPMALSIGPALLLGAHFAYLAGKRRAGAAESFTEQREAGDGPAPAETDERIYWADATGRVYHHPSCASARRISFRERVVFRSPEEAQEAGYRPCKLCNPPL